MSKVLIKSITDYEGYYDITSSGRVFSKKRKVPRRDHYKTIGGMFLKSRLHNGYPIINLHKEGKMKTKMIHRLVAQHFIPNPLNKPQVNHKDGNKSNNSVENLEWATSTENKLHAAAIGLAYIGELNGCSKLTKEQVKEMRFYHKTKRKSNEKTWDKYNISSGHYYDIINRKYWAWLEDD